MTRQKNRLQGLDAFSCLTGTPAESDREFVAVGRCREDDWDLVESQDRWFSTSIPQEVRGSRSSAALLTYQLSVSSKHHSELTGLPEFVAQLVNLLKEQYRARNIVARLENAEGLLRSLSAQVHVCSAQLEDLAEIVPVVRGLTQRFPDTSPIAADLFYARDARQLEGAEDILAILRSGDGPEIQLTTLLKSRRSLVEDRLYELEKLVLKSYPGAKIDFFVSVGRKWDDVERLVAAGARLLYDSRKGSKG